MSVRVVQDEINRAGQIKRDVKGPLEGPWPSVNAIATGEFLNKGMLCFHLNFRMFLATQFRVDSRVKKETGIYME